MVTNVDKESQVFIKELISAALKSPIVNEASVVGLAVFQQSIKLIKEEKPKDTEVLE